MTKLILIRHGETDYTSQKKYCGVSNPPLNDKGKQQARALGKRLKNFKIDKVYSSDLKRTCQTAEIIFNKKTIEKSSDFQELNFGVLEGLCYKEIMKKYPDSYQKWLNNPLKNAIPEGERSTGLKKKSYKKIIDYYF
jgi:broad specificity phosphatase PhoE